MADTEQRKWRIAKRFKEARSKSTPRLSQAEIARKVVDSGLSHFTERHASRLELGYMEATSQEVAALARVLAVNADWLCGKDRPAAPIQPAQPATGLARAAGTAATNGNGHHGDKEKPGAPPTVAAKVVEEQKWPTCPGEAALNRGTLSDSDYRAKLNELKVQTNRMLHTSGLPASEWRQWRKLEKHINERFREVP